MNQPLAETTASEGRTAALRYDIVAGLTAGAANLGGAFFGAMPVGGGTSQTAVVRAAGGRSQKASLVTAGTAVRTAIERYQALQGTADGSQHQTEGGDDGKERRSSQGRAEAQG